ncbi:MAG: PAS-domain containing protein, partial [Holosporales bacterium]|nr:PAS-domain containing protein [Holosporales bacterium]
MIDTLLDYLEVFFEEILLLLFFLLIVGGGIWSRRRIKHLKTRLVSYEAIGKTAQDGWAVWNIDRHYLGCSSYFRSILGVSPVENLSLVDIVASFNETSVLKESLNALRKERNTFSLELTTRKTNLQVSMRGFHVIHAKKAVLCLWLHDNTPHKQEKMQWQNAVREAEKKHAHLLTFLDALSFPIWHRRPGDLRVDYCNKAYADIVEATPERVLLENIALIQGPAAHAKTLALRALGEKTIQQAKQNIISHGKSCHVIVHETPFENGTIGFALDATESVTAKKTLERHMTAFAEIFDLLSTAIAIFGTDMRLNRFNRAYVRLMGLDEKWLHTSPSFGSVLEELLHKRKLPEVVDFASYKKEQIALFQGLMESKEYLLHLPNESTLRSIIAPHSLGGLLFLYEDVTNTLTLERKYNTL